MSVLLADIGGTNSRLCLADDSRQLFRATTYENRNFDSFEKVLQAFLDETADSPRPSTVALAIAGPVFGDRVQMVNLDWGFSRKELTAAFGFDRFEVLNDFSALATGTRCCGPRMSPVRERRVTVAESTRIESGSATGASW